MKIRTLLAAAVLVGGTATITTAVVSAQHQDHDHDHDAMMEMMMKIAEPGPQHELLATMAGTWKQKSQHFGMDPTVAPQESQAVATYESILGGRYVIERLKGGMNIDGHEMPFEGLGIYGYDNLKETHVFAWVDTRGTMIMTGEGTADESGRVITYYSEMPEEMGGKMKSVLNIKSDDERTMEMYSPMPDGSWHRVMKLHETRKDKAKGRYGAR